jgi:hypothetical protein
MRVNDMIMEFAYEPILRNEIAAIMMTDYQLEQRLHNHNGSR